MMIVEDKTQYEQPDDKFLPIGKLVANILLGVECGFFVIFGIIGCANVSMIYLLWVFLGPAFSVALWVFERVLLSLCHDVKLMRNKMMGSNGTPRSAQTPVEQSAEKPDKVFCMNCGTENSGEARFCRKCGNKLSL